MKQLLILSGKGGTGKTTIASAFIRLSNAKAYADCDVDAPNLHLVMKHFNKPRTTDFYGLPKAEVNIELCIHCHLCIKNCQFGAITEEKEIKIDPFSCEGCGVCEAICPAKAISLKPAVTGELMLYTDDAVFSTAQLKTGSGNSGLLVTEVKKQMKEAIKETPIAIIDGSPGIGCPVIASLNGIDMVLIVAEPSVSGIQDMERIIKTAKKLQTKIAVCVNKYDINLAKTQQIEVFCEKSSLPFVGKIPYDSDAVKAINEGKCITDFDCFAGEAVKGIYAKTMELLLKESED